MSLKPQEEKKQAAVIERGFFQIHGWRCVPVTPGLGIWKQIYLWCLLLIQPSLQGEYQAQEKPHLKVEKL